MDRLTVFIVAGLAVLAAVFGTGVFVTSGTLRDVILAIFGSLLGLISAALFTNVYLDRRSRRIAAAPLAQLVNEPIVRYHNDMFIELGRKTFGRGEFNRLIEMYDKNGRSPQAFSPAERAALSQMIQDNLAEIEWHVVQIDARMSDLITVLGWTFDPHIVGSALMCKYNISKFLLAKDGKNDDEQGSRIETYIDIDATASGVVRRLYGLINHPLIAE